MTEVIYLGIRKTNNGFIVNFPSDEMGQVGDEFVAISTSDLRLVVKDQIDNRLEDIINRLLELNQD